MKVCVNCKKEYLFGLRLYCTNRCKYNFEQIDSNKDRLSKYRRQIKIKISKSKVNKRSIYEITGRNITREKIRIRDNFTCQLCGKVWVFGRRRLDVHHKDCDKEKTKQYDNYEKEKDNLITLCHKCHLNLPEHKEQMRKAHK